MFLQKVVQQFHHRVVLIKSIKSEKSSRTSNMTRRNDDEKRRSEENDDYYDELADDPYATPTEDKYATPSDTDTTFSKFIEDKWAGDPKDDEGNYDAVDDINIANKKKNKKEQQIKTKDELSLELGTAGICGLLFVRNFVEGGMIGMVFGSVKGVINGYQTGMNKAPGFARSVYSEAAINGRSLGLWLGTYRASKVFFLRTRGVNDQLNTFLGGFCAGSMYMLHTRSPVQIITSGLSSGAMLSVLAAFGGSSL